MKKLTLLLLGIFLFGFGFSQTKTLEVNPAAGDEFTADGVTLTWTIGEGVIETFSNNEMILTQGFQQPTLKVTLIEESEEIDFQLSVYPNPTHDFFNISIVSENEINYSAQLMDMSGKLLYSQNLKGKDITETVDLTNYSSSIYILRIIDNNGKFARTYKVQKIK